MDYFALFDTRKIIEGNKKKVILSKKEYANICLNCPYKKCIGTYTGCDRTKPYKVLKEKEENEN